MQPIISRNLTSIPLPSPYMVGWVVERKCIPDGGL